jgi:hypothetical protein
LEQKSVRASAKAEHEMIAPLCAGITSGKPSESFRDRLVGDPQRAPDGEIAYPQLSKACGLRGYPLVGKGRPRLKQRESQRKLGGGSNWLRSRPLSQ